MRIRDAQEQDADTLTDVMRSAKRSWSYPDAWMDAWAAGLTISPEDIAAMRVRVAEDTHGILGFYALMGSGSRVQLEHLWIDHGLKVSTATGRSGRSAGMAPGVDPSGRLTRLSMRPITSNFSRR